MNVPRILGQWNFWRKAQNRHGVHSPFIYRFLDEGLYRRDLINLPPQQRLLMAAADHFRPVRALSGTPQSALAGWLGNERPHLRWQQTPTDLLICDTPGEELLAFLDKTSAWKNDTVVFAGNLRKNNESYEYWRRALRHPSIRIALETYPAGLLFFRTQQVRQHFKIRI